MEVFSWMPYNTRKILGLFLSRSNPETINFFYNLIFKNKNNDNFIAEKAIKTFES